MCNTIGCPNFDNPPLCADCTDAKERVKELERHIQRLSDELERNYRHIRHKAGVSVGYISQRSAQLNT
jgi:hypothetical protein